MTNFFIYMIGSLLVAGGLAFAAYQLGLSQAWIIAIALIIVGFGVMGGIRKTQKKEDPE